MPIKLELIEVVDAAQLGWEAECEDKPRVVPPELTRNLKDAWLSGWDESRRKRNQKKIFILEECSRCGTVLQDGNPEHVCVPWEPTPHKLEFEICRCCNSPFVVDGNTLCLYCRKPINRTMKMLFEDEEDEEDEEVKPVYMNECRNCSAVWTSDSNDFLCKACAKTSRIAIGDKLK